MNDRPPIDMSTGRLKILDLGTMVAGPVIATLLGDLGAEVIKVEQPGTGDPTREGGGLTARWEVEGRNKRSVTLNLRVDAGQQILRSLTGWADILVENFRPGTMQAWGLGYEELAAINPGLVYVSVSGYGQDGPRRELAGYDHIGAAFGGLTSVTGYADRPPVLPGMPVVDYATAAFAAVAAVEAVRRRDLPGSDGRGRWVDCALYETALRMAGPDFVNFSRNGMVRGREGGMPLQPGRSETPHAFTYRTRDGRWVAFHVALDRHWAKLVGLVGDPTMLEPRFASKQQRYDNASEVYDLLAQWFLSKDLRELDEMMGGAGLPFSAINDVQDIASDPHVQARQNLVSVHSDNGDHVIMQDAFPRFERGNNIRWPGELLGASTRQVYRELLELDDQQLDRLASDGVI
jgi:crotonobetainyl-CoA:carnitine CoA-transferase CaiB-like acyl-CoA transferase